MGCRTGDGRCRLLPQAPIDLDGGQLGPALARPPHQPAPLAAHRPHGPVDLPSDGGRHLGGRQHREWGKPLAGDWADPNSTLGTGQTLCGAPRGIPLRPLETQWQRPKTALARHPGGLNPADSQAAQPQHRCPHWPAAVADGLGRRPFQNPPTRCRRSRRPGGYGEHLAQ